MWAGVEGRSLRSFQGVQRSKLFLYNNTQTLLSFPNGFPHECTVEFSRGYMTYGVILSRHTHGIYVCVFLGSKGFVLISHLMAINSYSLHEQKDFGGLQ